MKMNSNLAKRQCPLTPCPRAAQTSSTLPGESTAHGSSRLNLRARAYVPPQADQSQDPNSGKHKRDPGEGVLDEASVVSKRAMQQHTNSTCLAPDLSIPSSNSQQSQTTRGPSPKSPFGLEDLPAEILEVLTWESLNPCLPIT